MALCIAKRANNFFTHLGESLRAQVKCLESRALDWVGDYSMPGEDGQVIDLAVNGLEVTFSYSTVMWFAGIDYF